MFTKYVYLYEESDGYGWAQWDRASGNKLSFRAKLYNHSTTRTLKAAELYYYTEDVWGERTHSGEYYHTSKVTLEPGEKGYSDWVNLPGYDEISEVYCGIKRLVFTDGKTVEYDDDEIDYKCWTVD